MQVVGKALRSVILIGPSQYKASSKPPAPGSFTKLAERLEAKADAAWVWRTEMAKAAEVTPSHDNTQAMTTWPGLKMEADDDAVRPRGDCVTLDPSNMVVLCASK